MEFSKSRSDLDKSKFLVTRGVGEIAFANSAVEEILPDAILAIGNLYCLTNF